MNVRNINSNDSQNLKTLKVIHKSSGKLEVYFPFSEVPIEMTPQYFEKNVDLDNFKVDFRDEYNHPKAG